MNELLKIAFEYGMKFEGRAGDENYSFEQLLSDNAQALQLLQSPISGSLPVKEFIVAERCGQCPACDGEFEICQIDSDVSTDYNKIPDKCPLHTTNYLIKLSGNQRLQQTPVSGSFSINADN